MRVLFVVQRYGAEVAGGAELACRQFATRLAGRGHDVAVVTSCATSYVDWADTYRPGTSRLDGVTVHRLGVHTPRRRRYFEPLDARTLWAHRPAAPVVQDAWMAAQGPDVRALGGWLRAGAARYDMVVFFTYLYWTTWKGLEVLARAVPTVLHPTAHDEPPLWLTVFDHTLRAPDLYAWSTPEERALLERRVGRAVRGEVVGIGTAVDRPGEGHRFRTARGLGHRPYLLYVGRVDPAKGAVELYEQFVAYKQRRPGSPLALIVIGEEVSTLPAHPDVIATGFVDDREKADALAGCVALAQPSYFESFSMVLSEAWAQGRPALVQGHCDVLAGQVARSGGGVAYRDFAEWEAALDVLVDEPSIAARLGDAGRAYVEANYRWDTVMDRYEALLRQAAPAHRSRPQAVG